ncbi:SAP domain-containing protein [Duncaniella muris]|uniref:SAP domain-containing protein n=1 Tax=Duncaniella muris TaxID=2094150 RepID=UPI00272BA46C|nr:SAP domain-containing protein [Duncaniella muris]
MEGRVALPEEGEESRGGGEDNVEDNIPGKRLEDMTIEELRQLAGETGIRKSGSREQLLERLRQNSDMGAEETLEEAEIPELTAEEPQ